jgi:glycosyltransferase involved in cell wall biosynthesis
MRCVFLDTLISADLIGGGQLMLPGLLAGLGAHAHEVHLVFAGVPNVKVRGQIQDSGARIHSGVWDERQLVDDRVSGFAGWVNNLEPDVFVVSTSADMGWVVLPLLNAGIATVVIGHNDSASYYEPAKYYRDFLTRVVGVSDEICEKYVTECGVKRERVEWIPYGVRSSEEPPAASGDGHLKIVYVGRVEEEQKRISDVVKTAKILTERGVDFVLEIVGDGESMPMVRAELSGEVAAGKVVLHGWLDGDKAIEVMRRSEVFLLASAFEGFCIALTESMANGCTPVVTNIKSGNKQLVEDGVNGFVVPIGDAAALADRISVLAADRGRLLEFRKRAWETGRQYSVDRMVDAYEDCFERAVADARADPRRPDPDFPLMPSCRSKYPLWLRRVKAKIAGR